jgi:hypothetical protein
MSVSEILMDCHIRYEGLTEINEQNWCMHILLT